jgi:hypothetical protein
VPSFHRSWCAQAGVYDPPTECRIHLGGELDTMQKTKCEGCGRQTPSFEIVEFGSMKNGYKQLCRRCFNSEAAAAAGLKDFEHVEFDPIRLKDSEGKVHEFPF